MGALAASTSSGDWLVEDDILLKNAIEHPVSMIKDEDATHNAPYVYSDVQMYDTYTQKVPEPSEVNNVSLRGITEFQDSMQFNQLASNKQCGNEVAESKEMLITDQVGAEHVHFPANNSGEAIWNGVDETDTLTLADGKKVKTANKDPLALQADGGICMPGLDDAAMPEGDYMDFPFLSNSDEFDLLNGENFLNSPHDTNQEDLDDPDPKGVLGADSVMQNMLHPDEANICYDQVNSGHVQHNVEGVSEMILVPTSPEVCYPGQYVECMLNTEDPEIPCNDDAGTHGEFSPLRPTASFARNSESPFPPSTSSPLKAERSNGSDLVQIMKLSPSTSEQKEGSVALNKGCILGAMASEGPSTSSALMHGSIDTNDESACMLALPAIHPSGFGEGPSCSLGQHNFFDNAQSLILYNSVQVPDHMNYNSHDNQSELQDASALQNCMSSHGPASAPAPPEECLDMENDIPNYYDLEALILDQDLIPWDQGRLIHLTLQQAKKGGGITGVKNNRKLKSGRKKINFDLNALEAIPRGERTTSEQVAGHMNVSTSTVWRRLKMKEIKRITSELKPALTAANERARVE
ncbi:Microspherule protein 1 [Hordeum vulgare]|nr:Microspherule protein 1 [Hordeum vulgare]